jgi:hypothetical protein
MLHQRNDGAGEGVAAFDVEAEHIFQLAGADEDRGACGKGDHHRVRDEVDQHAEPGKAEGELIDTRQESQGQCQLHELGGAGGRMLTDGREDHQGDRRGGS